MKKDGSEKLDSQIEEYYLIGKKIEKDIDWLKLERDFKWTKGRKKVIEIRQYFQLPNYKGNAYARPMFTAEQAFILQDEKGLAVPFYMIDNLAEYRKLLEADRWTGIHIQMYQEGILDGSTPYDVLLRNEDDSPISRGLAKYLAGNLFRGIDKEIIMNHYETIVKEFKE